jgi:hypothetical protein
MLVGPLKPKHFTLLREDNVGNFCLLLLWRRWRRGTREGCEEEARRGGGKLDARQRSRERLLFVTLTPPSLELIRAECLFWMMASIHKNIKQL